MIKFNTIDITDTLAVLCLGIGFIISVNSGMDKLAASIATGFFGYIGGVASANNKQQTTSVNQKSSSTNSTTGVTNQETTKTDISIDK